MVSKDGNYIIIRIQKKRRGLDVVGCNVVRGEEGCVVGADIKNLIRRMMFPKKLKKEHQ